jgi:pseudaminic acid cytidylyltransferase
MRLAVIPARGGSKRIPRKNVRPFAGKPMIAHSISAALASGAFDRVIVSTDDEEIARVARDHGAETPFVRPDELSNDHAATIPVVAHALRWAQDSGNHVDGCCCIYATAPFVTPDDLRNGAQVLFDGEWRYVFAATTFAFPIFRSIRRLPTGGVEMFYPEHFGTRSQDLPEAWHDAGQFYWGRPEAWLNSDAFFAPWSTVVPLPRWRVQDIDTPEDWERAELMFRCLGDGHIESAGGGPR